jgi:hypothetical protein
LDGRLADPDLRLRMAHYEFTIVAPKRVKAAGIARCTRSRSLQRDGLKA